MPTPRFSHALLLMLALCGNVSAQQYKTTDGYKNINGTDIYYETVGRGEPILVVHGGPAMNHDYFLPHLLPLSEKHKLIFYDQRASGRSAIPVDSNKSISYKIMIDDIEALRKAFGIKKLTLLAHSWGAKLAVNYALQYPQNTGRLILTNPLALNHSYDSLQMATMGHRVTESDTKRKKTLLESPAFSNGDLNAYRDLLRIVYKSSFYDTSYVSKLNIVLPDNFYRSNAALMKGLMTDDDTYDIDYYPALSALNIPVLIIQGRADNIPVQASEQLHNSIPGSSLVVFDSSGHFPFIEQNGLFVKEVTDFMYKKK